MSLIADTHVHLYRCYDLERALTCAAENLGALASSSEPAVFLAERHDCHVFRDLKEGAVKLSAFKVAVVGESLLLSAEGKPVLRVFPGRQIITAERIEVLALTTDLQVSDGRPAEEVIARVREQEGIPVLSWAPGKWFFGRGVIVAGLIEKALAGELLLGDSSLRPGLWPEPILFRAAAGKGIGIVAGSDPLPFPGEETYTGTYASELEGTIDPACPVSSAREILRSASPYAPRRGKRCGMIEVFRRLQKNAAAKKHG